MGRECLLTHTSQRRNKSQEQALPIPAIKAVPVYGKMPNSLFRRGSPTAMPDMAQLSQCYRGHHLPACLLKNVATASVVQLRCALQEGAWLTSQGMAAHQGRQNPDSSAATALPITRREMSAPCSKPVLDTGDSTGSAPWCSSVKSYLWLSLHQAPLWGALSNFYINKKPASYIAHTPTYLPGYMEKVNSERFYVPLVWLDTLCFNTSTGSQGRNKVFSFQSAWTWHLLPEGFVLFVLSQLHFNSVQQCWKTWQNIPECLISMNGQTSKS